MRPSPTRRARLAIASALALTATTALTATLTVTPAQAASSLPSVGTAFATAGPFQTTSTVSGQTTYFYPTTVGADGTKHPLILWGNGGGATVSMYTQLLTHLASHGFVVAAAQTSQSNSGKEMLAGIDGVTRVPALANAVDLTRIGATGHSLGAVGSLAAGADPRVSTSVPMNGCLTTPTGLTGKKVLYLLGATDPLAKPEDIKTTCFDKATDYAAAFGEALNTGHLPVQNTGTGYGTDAGAGGGAFLGVLTAWMRWQLADDTNAQSMFVGTNPGLATNPAWKRYLTNTRLQSLAAG